MRTPEKHFVLLDLPLEQTLQPVSVFRYPGSEAPAASKTPGETDKKDETIDDTNGAGWARFTVIQGL